MSIDRLKPLSDRWTPPRAFRPARSERFAEEELVITRYADEKRTDVIEIRTLRPTPRGWEQAA